MAENLIRLENVEMTLGGKRVLNKINLNVRDREFLTLLGPSGCGKTTTLRIIGGFIKPTAGVVYFDGKIINDLPPHKRPLNTVFQKYALFTHMNVYENIAFALRLQKAGEETIRLRVEDMLSLVNLKGYEKRDVSSLSGGEQQRVAIARALANLPHVLLLDEPLGALDLKLRKEMQTELKNIQTTLGITFIYVTHDQEEALTMSDTIAVMRGGDILQIGSPTDIYNEPSSAFVADFIGESNIIDGVMLRDMLVRFCGQEFPCLDSGFGGNTPVDVVVRPEDINVCAPSEGQLSGVVKSVVFKGVHYEMMAETPDFTFMIHSTDACQVGELIGMHLTPDDIHIMHKSGGEG